MIELILTLAIVALAIWLVVNIIGGVFTLAGLGSPVLGIIVVIVLLIVLANRT